MHNEKCCFVPQGISSLVLATAVALLSRRRAHLNLPPRAYTAAATLGAVAWMQVTKLQLQAYCTEIARVLYRNCKSTVQKLQEYCTEIARVLYRNCKSTVQKLQE